MQAPPPSTPPLVPSSDVEQEDIDMFDEDHYPAAEPSPIQAPSPPSSPYRPSEQMSFGDNEPESLPNQEMISNQASPEPGALPVSSSIVPMPAQTKVEDVSANFFFNSTFIYISRIHISAKTSINAINK
jgi:hypothetical protein